MKTLGHFRTFSGTYSVEENLEGTQYKSLIFANKF